MSNTAGLAGVLRAAGITTVIWIDDKFDAQEGASSPEATLDVLELLATLYAAKRAPDHPRLATLSVDSGFDVWRAVAQELADDVVEVGSSLRKQVESMAAGAAGSAEYTAMEFGEILASFNGEVERLGLAGWRQRKDAIKAALGRNVLVMVDREFRIAGVTVGEGEEILRDLLIASTHEASVLLLTHSVSPGGADALRRELAVRHGLPVERFSVVAKSGEGGAEGRLRRSVRVVMTHRTCFSLLQRVADVMRDGIGAACTELGSQSVYDLDLVIFEKSLEEGASEVEVMARLVQLRQRVAVDVLLAVDHRCFEDASALRRLRSIEELSPAREGVDGGALNLLPEWRRDEVFDPGARVNPVHAPIACGDVFQAPGASGAWVLLAQPCDIAVRPDGTRKFDEAVWVKAKALQVRPPSAAGGEGAKELGGPRFFRLPGLIGAEEWQMDFNDWGSVNLHCLDLAAYNTDGTLKLSDRTKGGPAMLPGWARRLERAAGELRKALPNAPKTLQLLSLSERISHREPRITNGELAFKFTRVGRVRSPRAVAAYAAFASYQSRAAFDHDFAEKLSTARVG